MNSDAINVPTHNVRAITALHAGPREDVILLSAAICTLKMASGLLRMLDPTSAMLSNRASDGEDGPGPFVE
jgi:hypothetical protein